MSLRHNFAAHAARLVLSLLLFVLVTALPVRAQLSGNYTIGSGGSYASFTAAAAALGAGVSGPVTFNVISGTYTEQFTLGAISGTSATNRVTFQAQSGNAADVTLRFTPTSGANYVVYLNGSDFVTFTKLTVAALGTGSYGVVFRIAGDANNITISNSVLTGITVNSSASQWAVINVEGFPVDELTVTGNTITNGSYGVYAEGVNTTTRSDSTRVTNNTISNSGYSAITLNYQNSCVANGNVIDGANNRGISFYYCHNDIQVLKNKITNVGQYGIIIQNSNGGSGFPPAGLIANNMIEQNANGAGIWVGSCTYQNIFYNSVYVVGTSSAGYYGQYNGGNVSLQNNAFANFAGGYAINVYGGSETSDYNDLFTTGNNLARQTNTDYVDLGAWIGTGKDLNSVSYYPGFLSATNLHTGSTWLNAKAVPLAEVVDDFDGNARNVSTPDIGADEYVPTALAPLSGTYTIGAGQNYTTFRAAAAALMDRGVSGPVTFNAINGTYNDHFILLNIPGASESNTVTFQSSTNVTSGVTIVFNAAAPESNYVAYLLNADYVKFHKMTLRANNNTGASYSTVFVLSGNVDNFTVDSCNVFGYSAANSSANFAIVYANNSLGRNITFNATTFNTGGYGVYWQGLSNTAPATGITITGCSFLSQAYTGIALQYADRPQITGNTITGAGSRGIDLSYCHNDLLVERNKVTGVGSYGIMVQNSNGGSGFPPQGLVANNFVQCGSNSSGIYVYSSTNQYIYSNSVNITGGSSQAYYDAYSNATIAVKNNNFVNFGAGYAAYTYSSGDVMDYNNLFTSGNTLARATNTDYVDLAVWQSGTGRDANSISVYPSFTSTSNLHTGSTFLNGRGTPLPEVFDDIDGEVRDATTPDIGADEYTPTILAPLNGTYTVGAGQTYTTIRSAANALQNRGVSGPVTFNISNGTYNEHFILYGVPGVNETNTVTFQSTTNNAAGVTMVFNAAAPESNYVVYLLNTDYIKFHKMTLRSNNNVGASYSTVFVLSGGVDNFTLDSCNLFGFSSANSSANFALVYAQNVLGRYITFNATTFNTGGYGIYWDGISNAYATTGMTVMGNTFLNQAYAGAYFRYLDHPLITGNTVTGAGSRGFDLNSCMNDVVVTKNKVTGVGSYGIMLQSSNGGTGFPPQGLVANNFVQVGANGSGIYIYSCTNQFIYQNSVSVTGGSSQAYYDAYSSGIAVKNNVFANTGGGYAVNAYSSTEDMDYNAFFTIGNVVARLTNTDYTDFATWQSATGRDANSIVANPVFTSATNLHSASHFLDAHGVVLPEIFDDIDGETRDGATPDIGADEFAPDVATAPMSGTYTIGTGGNYTTWDAASNALNARGVSGAVTFNVLPGTYQESVVFLPVTGASATNTITFQSSSGNPVGTTLASLTTAESSYVALFYAGGHFRFKNLSIRTNTNVGASYGIGFYLYGRTDDFQVDHCIFSGVPASNSSTNFALIYSNASVTRDLQFTANTFNDGGYGLYLAGPNSTNPSTGTLIAGNTMNNPDYSGITLQYQDAPVVRGNSIINADGRAIDVEYCYNGLTVTRNRCITDGSSAIGIYENSCQGSVENPGVVANNFIVCTGSNATGTYTYYSTNQRILFNSINMTGGSSNGITAYGGSANSNIYQNNSVANPGGGYAFYVYSPEGIGLLTNNNYWTSGAKLAYWGGDRATLGDLQTASGKETNSRSVVPGYYSATNLHVSGTALDSAGTAVGLVTDDFDGEPRDANNPDIGADEYSVILTNATQMPAGWNMISLPLSVLDNRKTILFPTSVSNAFAYEPPAGYVQRDTIRNMVGYWLKFPSAQEVDLSGAPVLRDSASVKAGWNLIGAIDVPVPKNAIIQSPGGNVASNYFEYIVGSGYVTADTLKPGKAFWVKTNNPGKLTLDVAVVPPKAVAGDRDERQEALATLNELSFTAGSGRAVALYFGSAGLSTLHADEFALPPAPPVEAADVRFDGDRYVALLDPKGGEVPLALQGAGTEFRLRWSIREASGLSYVLVERTGGATREIALRGSGTVTVSSAKRYALRVEGLPATFALAQNYPNPFNPTTTVRFDLPAAATVTLRVFTMLGQEILSPLDNAAMEAGVHTVGIDARNWASGTYIYRLTATDAAGRAMTATRKMVLLK